jgi:hypothetical protein
MGKAQWEIAEGSGIMGRGVHKRAPLRSRARLSRGLMTSPLPFLLPRPSRRGGGRLNECQPVSLAGDEFGRSSKRPPRRFSGSPREHRTGEGPTVPVVDCSTRVRCIPPPPTVSSCEGEDAHRRRRSPLPQLAATGSAPSTSEDATKISAVRRGGISIFWCPPDVAIRHPDKSS